MEDQASKPLLRSTISKEQSVGHSGYSTGRTVLICVMVVLEMFLFGGMINGWTYLMYIYEQAGIYSHLCSQSVEDEMGNK